VTAGAVPVPVRDAVCGDPEALLNTDRVPVRVPVALGEKVTPAVQVFPGVIVSPAVQVFPDKL